MKRPTFTFTRWRKGETSLDLLAPRKPGEKALTTLQLTRLQSFVERRLSTIVVVGTVTLLSMMLAFGFFVHSSRVSDHRLSKQNAALKHEIKARAKETAKNKKTSCGTIQDLQLHINTGIQGTEDLVTTVFKGIGSNRPQGSVDPVALQHYIDLLNSNLDKTKITDVRDCTDAGIAAYFADQAKKGTQRGPTTTTTTKPGG